MGHSKSRHKGKDSHNTTGNELSCGGVRGRNVSNSNLQQVAVLIQTKTSTPGRYTAAVILFAPYLEGWSVGAWIVHCCDSTEGHLD